MGSNTQSRMDVSRSVTPGSVMWALGMLSGWISPCMRQPAANLASCLCSNSNGLPASEGSQAGASMHAGLSLPHTPLPASLAHLQPAKVL